MSYLVELDPLKAVCSDEDKVLSDFLKDSNLEDAFLIVSCEDELGLALTDNELETLAANINSEKSSPESIYATLEDSELPMFKKVRKKLLAGPKDTPEPKAKAAPKVKSESSSIRITEKMVRGQILENGKDSRAGTVFGFIKDLVDDNMGEVSYEDLLSEFVETYVDKKGESRDEKFARGYILGAVKEGRLVIQEEL